MLTNNLLLNFKFSDISPNVLWIFFGVFLLVVTLLSIVLIYHWNKYRLHSPGTLVAPIIYTLGIVLFLILATSALLFHTLI